MKKKFFCLVLALMLIFTAGCQKENAGNQEGTTEITQSGKNQTEKVEKPEILKQGIATDETGVLLSIANAFVEEGMQQEICLYEDKLLLSGSFYDKEVKKSYHRLRLLSLSDGEVIAERTIEGLSVPVTQVCGNQIAVADGEAGKIYLFDENLNQTEEYHAKGSMIYLSPDAKEAYCFNVNKGIQRVDLTSGETKGYLENARNLFAASKNGNYVSFTYTDKGTGMDSVAALNLSNGYVEKLELDDSFTGVEYHDGVWYAWIMGGKEEYLFGRQSEPYQWSVDGSGEMVSLLGAPSRLMVDTTLSDNTRRLDLFDEKGAFLSSCVIPDEGGGLYGEPVWCENAGGYFMLVMSMEGHDKLYFWALEKDISGADLALKSYYEETPVTGDAVSAELYQKADELSKKYGVIIRIADQCSTDYTSKTVKQELDEKTIKTGLEVVTRALSDYPENFFGQLYHGSYRKIEINLMGEITEKVKEEAHGAIAFVEEGEGRFHMVLNLNRDKKELEQTFHHEVSHLIDKKLAYDAQYRPEAFYSEEGWEKLNPDFFIGYYNSYRELPMDYYKEEYNPYFVDFYCMTYPTEDRARTFEYAMAGKLEAFNPKIYDGCVEKLEYYCKAIRDGFDTTGWPETTKWEDTLIKSGGSLKK